MKKKIWILNHYASTMFTNKAGRHYWFAENLIKNGYNPTIFCASTFHNSTEIIETGVQKYVENTVDNIPFVFVETPKYIGNGKQRIKNMLVFYKNIFIVAKEYAKIHGKPDVILASSVHPLTLVAGIKIAKKFGIPCICEVRDLWPETLVAYGNLKDNNIFTKLLFLGEKWIYKNADKLIFTMEGGKDYIIERGWDQENGGSVDINKVHHINNGIDLEVYDFNKKNYTLEDKDLNREDTFKVVYTGSIRKVNNVKRIVEAAEIINKMGYTNIMFLIYGDGPEKEELEKYCRSNNLENILFKGFVDKNKVPYVLSKSNLNIMHFQQSSLKKYGASLNKMFEYFASGKPTISDCEFGYDLIQKYNAGIVLDNGDANQIAEGILEILKMSNEKYELYSKNALEVAKDYDFKKLTMELIGIIENKE